MSTLALMYIPQLIKPRADKSLQNFLFDKISQILTTSSHELYHKLIEVWLGEKM